MTPFEQFWAAWPRSFRKASKSVCQEKWRKQGLDKHAPLILAHVEFMKSQDAWIKDGGQYVPAPLVYINQKRWDGFEPPIKKETTVQKIERDMAKAAPMPENIRQKLQELRRGILTA